MKNLFTASLLLFSNLAFSVEFMVITHPSFEINLKKSDLVNIYMGRTKTLADGTKLKPIVQKATNVSTKSFYHWLVNKDVREIQSYWSRLLFSGRAKPPYEVDSPASVIEIVSKNPYAIGYISPKHLTKDVKVLFHVE